MSKGQKKKERARRRAAAAAATATESVNESNSGINGDDTNSSSDRTASSSFSSSESLVQGGCSAGVSVVERCVGGDWERRGLEVWTHIDMEVTCGKTGNLLRTYRRTEKETLK